MKMNIELELKFEFNLNKKHYYDSVIKVLVNDKCLLEYNGNDPEDDYWEEVDPKDVFLDEIWDLLSEDVHEKILSNCKQLWEEKETEHKALKKFHKFEITLRPHFSKIDSYIDVLMRGLSLATYSTNGFVIVSTGRWELLSKTDKTQLQDECKKLWEENNKPKKSCIVEVNGLKYEATPID